MAANHDLNVIINKNNHPLKHKERVLIVFDGDNFQTIRDIIGKIDIVKVSQMLASGRPISAVAFFISIPPQMKRSSNPFQHALEKAGIEALVYTRKRRDNDGGEPRFKDYSDAKIWRYVLERLDYFDTLILGTRDGDFIDFIQHLRRFHHKSVELFAIEKGIDRDLFNVIDTWWDLSAPDVIKQIIKD